MEYKVEASIQPREPGVGIMQGYCSDLEGLPERCECGHTFDQEAAAERAFEVACEGEEPPEREPWEDEEPETW